MASKILIKMQHLLEYIQFSELSEESKKKALENAKEEKGDSYYVDHVADDSFLLEPSQEEMTKIFGDDYYEANGNRLMIENGDYKKISFVTLSDQNYYFDCRDSIVITNDNMFLRWLGIPPRFRKYAYYTFINSGYRNPDTSIEFEIDDADSFYEKFKDDTEIVEAFKNARIKFDAHMHDVLSKITNDVDYEFEEDGIIDYIDSNDIKFDEEGNIIQD